MVEKSKPDIEQALKFTQKPYEVTMSSNDCILYALGIGFQQDAMNSEHYQYTYENAEGFTAYPTTPLVVCHRGPFADGDFDVPGIPAFNPMQLLHGEEMITIEKPFNPNMPYVVTERVLDLQDKGKGALLIFEATIKEKDSGAV